MCFSKNYDFIILTDTKDFTENNCVDEIFTLIK